MFCLKSRVYQTPDTYVPCEAGPRRDKAEVPWSHDPPATPNLGQSYGSSQPDLITEFWVLSDRRSGNNLHGLQREAHTTGGSHLAASCVNPLSHMRVTTSHVVLAETKEAPSCYHGGRSIPNSLKATLDLATPKDLYCTIL